MALLHFLRWLNEPEHKYNSHFYVGVLRRTFEDTLGGAEFAEGAHGSLNQLVDQITCACCARGRGVVGYP